MNYWRVTLTVRSALGTPLAADTLWGHIAWGLRYREGEAALADWLAAYDAGEPPLVLSDPLPAGYWPRPAAPRPPRAPGLARKAAADRKQFDRCAWLTHAAWEQLAVELDPAGIQKAVEDSPQPPGLSEDAVVRIGINRLTGGTEQSDGGALYVSRQQYHATPTPYDVWVAAPVEGDVVRRWFTDALCGGYGRDASAGLGQVTIDAVEPVAWPTVAHANACVLLGPTVPAPGDPARGFLQFGLRCGRLGGDYALGALPGGATSRQKRPVACLLAGTLLACDGPPPTVLGRVVAGVHPELAAIRHYGLGLALPCRLSAELSQHPLLQPPEAALA